MTAFQDTTPFVLALLISIVILIFLAFYQTKKRRDKKNENNFFNIFFNSFLAVLFLYIIINATNIFFEDTTHPLLIFIILAVGLIFILSIRMFKKNMKNSSDFKEDTFNQNENQKTNKEHENKHSYGNNESNQYQRYKQQKSTFQEDLKFFNLKENYTLDELKAARKRLIRENHPDKVNHMSDEIKKTAKKQTQKINEVFSRLEKKFKNN